ncbi:hypothetical protein NDU88_011083, partial [Pleurodeles waltl]
MGPTTTGAAEATLTATRAATAITTIPDRSVMGPTTTGAAEATLTTTIAATAITTIPDTS